MGRRVLITGPDEEPGALSIGSGDIRYRLNAGTDIKIPRETLPEAIESVGLPRPFDSGG